MQEERLSLRLRRITSFGRRHTRKLSLQGEEIIANTLPNYQLKLDTLPSSNASLELEIGFGDGDFLANMASNNPEKIFLGAEVFDQGIIKTCKKLSESKLENVYIWPDDAMLLLNALPDSYLTSIYILFPDPWPKLRHHKRRFIQIASLELMVSKLVRNGRIIIATDHPEYAKWAGEVIAGVSALRLLLEPAFNFEELRTKYRTKALASPNVYGFEAVKV